MKSGAESAAGAPPQKIKRGKKIEFEKLRANKKVEKEGGFFLARRLQNFFFKEVIFRGVPLRRSSSLIASTCLFV